MQGSETEKPIHQKFRKKFHYFAETHGIKYLRLSSIDLTHITVSEKVFQKNVVVYWVVILNFCPPVGNHDN